MKKQDTNRVTSNTVAQKVGIFFNKNASVLACMMSILVCGQRYKE